MTEHPDSLKLIHQPPWALTPPYNSFDHRLSPRRKEPADLAHNRIADAKTAVLLESLGDVETSDYERRVLRCVGCWETHTVAVIAALLRRARSAPPAA